MRLFLYFLISFFAVSSMFAQDYYYYYDDEYYYDNDTKASTPKQPSGIVHRVGFSVSGAFQFQPLAEIASLQISDAFYVKQYNVWSLGSAGVGFGANLSYDATLKNNFMARFQTGVEMTGSLLWVFECGIGVRSPMAEGHYLSVEAYFSSAHAWATLERVHSSAILPDASSVYTVFLGFKARIAYEIPLGDAGYFSTYLSYGAYPWHFSNLVNSDFFVNGRESLALDSFQIGFEFGAKI